MTKKRVSIYIDEGVWRDIRVMSLGLGISAGEYLVDLHLGSVSGRKNVFSDGLSISNNSSTTEEVPIKVLRDDTEVSSVEKINEIRGNIDSYFNPMPKGRQVGKK